MRLRYWLAALVVAGLTVYAAVVVRADEAPTSCLTPDAVLYAIGPVARVIVGTDAGQGGAVLAKHMADAFDSKWSGAVAILAFIGDTTATVYGFDQKGCEVIDQTMAIADYDAARVAIGLPPFLHLLAPAAPEKPPPRPDKSI